MSTESFIHKSPPSQSDRGRKLVREAEAAFTSPERTQADSVWGLIAKYCMPSQAGLFNNASGMAQSPQISKLMTNEGILASQTLSSTLMSTLMNESTQWLKPAFRDETLLDDEESGIWLEHVGKTMMTYLSQSNFYSEASKLWSNVSTFGSGVFVIEENNVNDTFVGVNFRGMHLAQTAWSEGKTGTVDRVYIKESLAVEVMLARYGKISSQAKKRLAVDPSERWSVITCNTPNKDGTYDVTAIEVRTGFILNEQTMSDQHILVPRWSCMTGESIGSGCGHTAVTELSLLNTMRFEHMSSKALANRPPLLVEQDNLLGDLNLKSGHISEVASVDGIRPLQLGGDVQSMMVSEQDVKESVRRAFLLDKLSLPPRTDTGEMSAFEVSRRVSEMSNVVAGVVSRQAIEFGNPLGSRLVAMLYRKGLLGEIPDKVKESGSIDLAFNFANQMSRSQSYEGVQALQNAFQTLAPLAQVNPSIMAVFDNAELGVEVCRDLGVPETYTSSRDAVKGKLEKAQQQAEQQAQSEQMKTALQAKALSEGGEQTNG